MYYIKIEIIIIKYYSMTNIKVDYIKVIFNIETNHDFSYLLFETGLSPSINLHLVT